MKFIDLDKQRIRIEDEINDRIQKVLKHGQYILGSEVFELEEKLAEFVGAKHCITISNGTDALLIAMMALGVKAGDEVITSPFTFIAIGEMIALLGAKPVFVDIDSDTYNIDPKCLAAAITDKTKAIVPISLFGQCANLKEINAIADKYNIPVIEDAAQSMGATHHNRHSCALSKIGCTSFFPSKPLGCYGDGGACFTNDDGLAKCIREIRVHGQDRRYHHSRIGMNGRLDTIQAAVLLAKLTIFPDEIKKRQKIADYYEKALSDHVKTPVILDGNTSVYAQYTIEIDNRDKVATALKNQDIPTAVHYPVPLNLQPAFACLNQEAGSFPKAEHAAKKVISLPMHPYLSTEEQRMVADALKNALVK